MAALRAALCALLALTCARAEIYSGNDEQNREFFSRRSINTGSLEVRGCMYSGRWFAEGAAVRAGDACLRCRCAHGALSCARAACAPTPDPPPRRCAVLHRRGACCPELHCPDGVRTLELEATGRMEDESYDVATPAAAIHACVEEGAVFAAGSALAARAACEQCFCLRGVRRCVRPRCLPPPPGCAPRPAPGACCPARYYCETPARNITSTTAPPVLFTTAAHRVHDCQINGRWIAEGDRVASSSAGAGNCTQCFCLRGAVRCQPLACAPALRGCTPLLRAGHCCAHQYHCPHHKSNNDLGPLANLLAAVPDNSLISTRNDERSFHTSASTKALFVAKTAPTSFPTSKSASEPPPATAKVKRKTNDTPTQSITSQKTTTKENKMTISQEIKSTTSKEIRSTTHSQEIKSKLSSKESTPKSTTKLTQTAITTTTAKLVSSTETTTTSRPAEQTTTEQPDGSVKIIINGTINCTAELSSTLSNMTEVNGTEKIEKDTRPRTPQKNNIEAQTTTLQPVDIITDRNTGGGFAEGDTFVINVTSSLNSNSSRQPAPPPSLTDVSRIANMTKKTKEDYDYDYTEPTLPPSLPNLKIIPFVAADAVVDDDAPTKDESLSYPIMEREDKFPVYYPTIEQKEAPYATRREDVYNPTQYPVFISEKTNNASPPELPSRSPIETKQPTSPPTTTTTREQTVPVPEVNLFSPPAETEGGFIPKGPGIIDEYYAVYPSTPPPVPHLTTSMQINPDLPDKVECVTHDGRRVPEGESVWLACSVCACAWGELHCAPRRCIAPPRGCRRRPATASSGDLCCGEIVCKNDNTTTPVPNLSTRRTEITLNVTKIPTAIESDVIPFDPPTDRSVPEPSNSTKVMNQDNKLQDNTNITNTTNAVAIDVVLSQIPNLQNAPNTSTSMPIGETKESATTLAPASTSTPESSSTTSSPAPPVEEQKETNYTDSQEYEDEDDDEEFSFGSVLKLLLSDNYDATTISPKKKLTTPVMTTLTPSTTTTRLPFTTTKTPAPKPNIPPFIPVQPHAYIPPKKAPHQDTVNRIDHLVLGEATAIRKTTTRPTATPFRPLSTPIRRFTTRTTTRKPIVTTRVTKTEEPPKFTSSPVVETARPAGVGGGNVIIGGGGGAGLLKLAGCNIYGRMYRVGRIIAELSTPCQECRCTEFGVQCMPLRC